MIIYGYNLKLSSHRIDTIINYSWELLEELKKVRNIEEISIIMICYYKSVNIRLIAVTR